MCVDDDVGTKFPLVDEIFADRRADVAVGRLADAAGRRGARRR